MKNREIYRILRSTLIAYSRGVIGEVRCGFLRIFAPTPYSTVFLFHAPTPNKIDLGAVRFDVVQCRCGLVVWV